MNTCCETWVCNNIVGAPNLGSAEGGQPDLFRFARFLPICPRCFWEYPNLFRFAPISSDLFSEQIRKNPFCRPLVQVRDIDFNWKEETSLIQPLQRKFLFEISFRVLWALALQGLVLTAPVHHSCHQICLTPSCVLYKESDVTFPMEKWRSFGHAVFHSARKQRC